MRNKVAIISLAVVVLSAVSVPLFAHHGNASYDTTKTITLKGTVTEYIWANPHVFLKVDAKDDSRNTSHWVIEAQSTVTQNAAGWSRTTFKAGDEVTLEVTPIKNGSPIGRFKGRIVIRTEMTATLSCDHRAVDGALGAELLSAFRLFIEEPALMLA